MHLTAQLRPPVMGSVSFIMPLKTNGLQVALKSQNFLKMVVYSI